MKFKRDKKLLFCSLILAASLLFSGCQNVDLDSGASSSYSKTNEQADQSTDAGNVSEKNGNAAAKEDAGRQQAFDQTTIPAYSGQPYVEVNSNTPFFADSELTTKAFEHYSNLDSLGRCGVAYANICKDIMPFEKRGPIGMVKPSGWKTVKYDNVDGLYLYNRCHLVGFQLAGENANERNLITGTRYLNVDGMLPFENMVADYVKETEHHVLYRVTPVFTESNLVASGVLMEARSVEDDGIEFCVYCYNVQPGIEINYATGDSQLSSDPDTTTENITSDTDNPSDELDNTYVINENTHKFHKPECNSVQQMNSSNRKEYTGSRQDLINKGYEPCQNCKP